MTNPLEKFTVADGVLAAALVQNGTTDTMVSSRTTVAKDKWQEIFAALATALDKMAVLGEEDLRIVAGDYTVTLVRFDENILAVATILGHPIAKSLRRMMSRSMRSIKPVSRTVPSIQASSPAI
jgi:hypothetical protein